MSTVAEPRWDLPVPVRSGAGASAPLLLALSPSASSRRVLVCSGGRRLGWAVPWDGFSTTARPSGRRCGRPSGLRCGLRCGRLPVGWLPGPGAARSRGGRSCRAGGETELAVGLAVVFPMQRTVRPWRCSRCQWSHAAEGGGLPARGGCPVCSRGPAPGGRRVPVPGTCWRAGQERAGRRGLGQDYGRSRASRRFRAPGRRPQPLDPHTHVRALLV